MATLSTPVRSHYVWEFPVRLVHWVNASSIVVLFFTGLFLATPFSRSFSMGRMREFHMIFGFALMLGTVIRVYWFFAGNNYARSGFPMFWKLSWYRAVLQQMIDYTKLDRGYVHIGHNSLAGASYAALFVLCIFQMVTGLALYGETNRGGFWDSLLGWTTTLLGGSYRVQLWHLMAAWFIVIIALFHVYIVLYDAQLYKDKLVRSMIFGEKTSIEGDHDATTWIS